MLEMDCLWPFGAPFFCPAGNAKSTSFIARRHDIAFGALLGDDALAINQRLGATERDETDLGDMCVHERLIAEECGKGKPIPPG